MSKMDMEARAYLSKFAGGTVRMVKDPTRGVAIITLDHPEKKNAITGRMIVELYDHIKDLETWEEGKAVILRGEGGNLTSGGDLHFIRQCGTPECASAMNHLMNTALNRLGALKMFSVCMVEGPTLGGGTEVALACDFILVDESVQFGIVHGQVGLVTAWGSGTRLTRRIGKSKALELLLTCRWLSAKECLDFGIADEIVPAADIDKWMEKRLILHHTLIRGLKEITYHADNLPKELAQAEERRIFMPFMGGELNKVALVDYVKTWSNTKELEYLKDDDN